MTADPAALDPAPCAPAAGSAMRVEIAAPVAVTLKALAEPLRLRILSFIATDPRGESCVCDLLALSDVSQPTVSHHLKVMKDAGLLESERRGTWVWYRIVPSRKAAITALLDSFAAAMLPEAVQNVEERSEMLPSTDGVERGKAE